MNRTALNLLNGLIALKEEILSKVLSCQMFTMNYPLLIEHMLREAKLYQKYVQMLEADSTISIQSMKEIECFWNQIMMEHALFIRGLLDPSEKELFSSADMFAKDYASLLEKCHNAQNRILTADSMTETKKFRDFKAAGALDYSTSKEILKLIESLNQKYGRTVVMVTHNDAIKNMANRVIKLRDGVIRKNYVNEEKNSAEELDW